MNTERMTLPIIEMAIEDYTDKHEAVVGLLSYIKWQLSTQINCMQSN